MTGITPVSFISSSYTVTNSTINAVTSSFLSLQINSFIMPADIIEIIFPNTITIQNILTNIVITNGNIAVTNPAITLNANGTTSVQIIGAAVNAGSTLQLQFYNVKNPPS